MKKIISFCFIIALTGLSLSCKKTVDKLTQFDISYATNLSVTAASYTASVPVDFDSPEIPTESSSKFSAEKTSKDLVSEVKLTKFNMSVTTGNLDALKSISIYLKSSSLGEVLIATKSSIPAGTTSVSLDTKDVNIKEYLFKDKIQFKATLVLGPGSVTDQQIKMEQTLHVKASLLK